LAASSSGKQDNAARYQNIAEVLRIHPWGRQFIGNKSSNYDFLPQVVSANRVGLKILFWK
jgi:hypothetical protein